MKSKWIGRIGWVITAIAVVNFLAYYLHIIIEGGGATSVDAGGHYYIGNGRNKWEVSYSKWMSFQLHQTSVAITLPLLFFCGIPLLAISRIGRPRMLGEK